MANVPKQSIVSRHKIPQTTGSVLYGTGGFSLGLRTGRYNSIKIPAGTFVPTGILSFHNFSYALISSSAICTALVAAPLRT